MKRHSSGIISDAAGNTVMQTSPVEKDNLVNKKRDFRLFFC